MLALIALPGMALAATERSLKALVFENCERAVAEAANLPPGDRADFVSYLGKVVTMQSHPYAESLFDPGAKGLPPGIPLASPGDDLRDFDPLRSFEPSRELDAKRCALRILAITAPESALALPDVVPLVNEPTLPQELRDLVASRSWEVIRGAVQHPEYEIARATLDRLAALSAQDGGWLAANLLVELREPAIAPIIELVQQAQPNNRERLFTMLARIDGGEGIVVERLATLLEAADDDISNRAARTLARLGRPRPKIVRELGLRLLAASPETRHACFEALREMERTRRADQSSLTPEDALPLLEALTVLSSEQREVLAESLRHLLPATDEILVRLLVLTESEDVELRAISLQLLGGLAAGDPRAKKRALDALYEPVLAVRVSALRALRELETDASEGWSVLLRFLKRLADEKNPAAREALLTEVVQSLEKLPQTEESERAVPYLVEALAIRELRMAGGALPRAGETEPIETAASRLLISIGAPADAALKRGLRKDDPLVRARAAHALTAIAPDDRDVAQAVAPLLKDPAPEVRFSAERGLAKGKQRVAAVLREINWGSDTRAKDAAMRVLVHLGAATPSDLESARSSLERLSCNERITLIPTAQSTDDPLHEWLERAIADCVTREGTAAEEAVRGLKLLAPLGQPALTRLRELLAAPASTNPTDQKIRTEVLLNILAEARTFGLTASDALPVYERLLVAGENAVRYRIVLQLVGWGAEASSASATLRRMLDETKGDLVLRCRIVGALAVVSPDSFDYATFFVQELERDGYQSVLAAIAEIGPERGVPVLLRAFEAIPANRRPAIVAALGKFSAGAASALDTILALAAAADPQLRSAVALAAMRIAPDDERSRVLYRRELLGRHGSRLASEKLPQSAAPALQALVAGAESWLERRLLEEASDHVEG